MKKNNLSVFVQKIENFPILIQYAILLGLSENIKSRICEKFLKENKESVFTLYKPILTFKGMQEIEKCSLNLDSNLYNFLSFCKNDFSILDISINTFLSLEEVAKYFILCIEFGYLENPDNVEIEAMAGFLSGKLRIGEYFAKKGVINDMDIQQAIDIQKSSQDMFAKILVDMGLITQEDAKIAIAYKNDSQKRFVLDYNDIPKIDMEFCDKEEKYKNEINDLKTENDKLRRKISQLLEIVKNYD